MILVRTPASGPVARHPLTLLDREVLGQEAELHSNDDSYNIALGHLFRHLGPRPGLGASTQSNRKPAYRFGDVRTLQQQEPPLSLASGFTAAPSRIA